MIFCVDKPIGITSNEAVQLIKRSRGFKKVGHAGTLDPDASGVLVIGTDESTKLLAQLLLDDKEYLVSIRFGVLTDTYDASGFVVKYTGDIPDLSTLQSAFASFPSTYQQVPPSYSAIKVNGKRAYAMMRDAQDVLLEPREASITEREFIAYEGGVFTFRLAVKKGFYIRSFAVDLAAKMGTLATVVALRRTRSGSYSLAQAQSMDAFGPRYVKRLIEEDANPLHVGDLLKSAQIERANELQRGFAYALTGTVVRGLGRARLLGYPTANIDHEPEDCLAADGVYKSVTTYDGFRFRSLTFIGISKEDSSNKHKFESHLFNFDGDLYGKVISSQLTKFIRCNASFDGREALVLQIAKDVADAKAP